MLHDDRNEVRRSEVSRVRRHRKRCGYETDAVSRANCFNNADPVSWQMSASLIGRLGSSAFQIRKLPQPTSLSSSGRKCLDTTNPMIRIGVARNAPIGPHNHVQNARAKKTIEELRLRFRPTM